MTPIDPGRFDRRITIQTSAETQDSFGEADITWSTFAHCWAEKLDVGGRERFQTSGKQAEVDAVFRIHYQSGITHKMRVYYNGSAYNILYINELGRKQYLELRTVMLVD